MRKIAIEEHFTTRTYQQYLQKFATREGASSLGQLPPQLNASMLNLRNIQPGTVLSPDTKRQKGVPVPQLLAGSI